MKKTVFIIIGLILLFVVLFNVAIYLFNNIGAWLGICFGVLTMLGLIYTILTVIINQTKKKT